MKTDRRTDELTTVTFTETELYRVINALETAAVKFTECAAIVRAETPGDGYRQIAGQFDRQAAQALHIARLLDSSDEPYTVPAGHVRRPGVFIEHTCGNAGCDQCYSLKPTPAALDQQYWRDLAPEAGTE